MTYIELKHLSKQYEDSSDEVAVSNFSLDIPSGMMVALLGPSGSGKTTTLKMLAGLITPTSGAIYFDGHNITNVSPENRGAAMVFQNHVLFPHMSVEDNIAFGLKMRKLRKKEIRKRVDEILDLVRLPRYHKRRPSQLSGGQQQRIALARSLVTDPQVLLLDEPLSSLDAHLRDEMRHLIMDIQRELDVTTVFVTHDQQEAVLMADRIALMFDGELHQYTEPRKFYTHPESYQTAEFFGSTNFISAYRDGQSLATPLGKLSLSVESSLTGDVIMTIRPDQIHLNVPVSENTATGIIKSRTFVGTFTSYKIVINDTIVEVHQSGGMPVRYDTGQSVSVHFPPENLWILPASGRATLA